MTRDDDMTDERLDAREPGFDDDRLLAFLLGFEDDPELTTVAESDAALRDRLEAMRAEVAAVGAGLERAVPAPPDDYTDLGDPRWEGLRDLVAAPESAAPRRRPFWVRVLAPTVALGLVLLVGVVGVQYLGGTGDGTAELSTSATDDKAAESFGDESGALQGDASSGAEESVDGAAAPSLSREAPNASAYATVLVARARTPEGQRQRFDVVRVLRGDAQEYGDGTVVTLDVVQREVDPNRLVVLYLAPLPMPTPATTGSGTATPSPTRELGRVLVSYRYRGGEALVLQLPADADPDSFTLP